MKKRFLAFFCAAVLTLTVPVSVFAEGSTAGADITRNTEDEPDAENPAEPDGWQEDEDGGWYYFENGEKVTGWKQIDGEWYYFYEDGLKATDTWIGEYYVDENGVWLEEYMPPHWVKSGNLWWYRDADGSWPASEWRFIDGKWYYFNAAGYMVTGWQWIGNAWYYLDQSGAMATGWLWDSGAWYYLNADGAMATGWLKDEETWYYLNNSGAMLTGWQWIGSAWYYLDKSGAMATGWLWDGGAWYYLNADGAMATGWLKDGETWYYLNNSGAMLTGWQWIGNAWYYLDESGAMRSSEWIGDYYVLEEGNMAVNMWIGDCYVDAAGKKVTADSRDQLYTVDLGNGKTATVYGHFDTAMADSIFEMLNEYREYKGVNKLERAVPSLQTAANVRGYETAYLFSHERPNGQDCFEFYAPSCAENIAMGYQSAEDVMYAWIDSPGHNANMLREPVSSVGISVFKLKQGSNYVNYFVQYFAE